MTIDYTDDTALLSDIVTVEEAEGLLAWLTAHPQGGVDLSRCRHLHTANLQVVMAARPRIVAWPEEPNLAQWLYNTLAEGAQR